MYQNTNTFRILGEELREAIIQPFTLIGEYDIYPKACYQNAMMIAKVMECEYVEGEVVINHPQHPISIIHAWNSKDGVYFDPTWAKFPPAWEEGVSYFPVVQGTIQQLESQGYKMNFYTDLVTQHWNKKNRGMR